jgi:hypothetical protein
MMSDTNNSDTSGSEDDDLSTIIEPEPSTSNLNEKQKKNQLTLEDNDEEDESAFIRPDMNGIIEIEGEGEGESEADGEIDDDLMNDTNKNRNTANSTSTRVTTSKQRQITKTKSNNKLTANKSQTTTTSTKTDDLKKKKKKKKQLGICVVATKYDCVRRVGKKLGMKEVDENEDWSLYWTDTSVSIDRVNIMKRWQKINHFPGMSEICRKDFLTRNMNRMAKLYPKDFTFYPKAWCLPADYADLVNYVKTKKNKTYICKPDASCQGKGIFLTKSPLRDIKPSDNYIAQCYVSKPFTIDDYKFDLRVYVAVTCCDPFRIFVYKEGLARFTTEQYEEPNHVNCVTISRRK